MIMLMSHLYSKDGQHFALQKNLPKERFAYSASTFHKGAQDSSETNLFFRCSVFSSTFWGIHYSFFHPQIFMHKSAMQMHSRDPHRAEVKPHQCQQCLKSFSSNHQLVQHIRVHTGEKPYKCSYCDRRFKQLSHVQQHTRLHTGKSSSCQTDAYNAEVLYLSLVHR